MHARRRRMSRLDRATSVAGSKIEALRASNPKKFAVGDTGKNWGEGKGKGGGRMIRGSAIVGIVHKYDDVSGCRVWKMNGLSRWKFEATTEGYY